MVYVHWVNSQSCFPPSAYSVQCLASISSSSSSHHCFRPCSHPPFLSSFPPATLPTTFLLLSGAAVSLHVAKERGLGGQGRGEGGVGWEGWRRGGSGGGGGAEEWGVRAHLVDVDVGGVEQDVVLPAEAGEDGGDARHQLGEGGPPLRLWMPALDHDRVAGGAGGERSQNEAIFLPRLTPD